MTNAANILINFVIINSTILGLIVLFFLVLALYAGLKITQRRKPDEPTTPVEYGMDFESVEFMSSDGILLKGWWIPTQPEQPTIIMCHGQNGSMDGDIEQAKILHSADFNVLMFDMRGHGQSGGNYVTLGIREVLDLRAASIFVRQNYDAQRIGALGFSMGATVAVRHAAEGSSFLQCLVLDGLTGDIHETVTRWLTRKKIPRFFAKPFIWLALRLGAIYCDAPIHHVKPERWIPQIKNCPMFFIHAEQDEFVDLETIQDLQAMTEEPTDIWVVPDCEHRKAQDKHPEAYAQHVIGWFRKHL